jgi:hypothetical protein
MPDTSSARELWTPSNPDGRFLAAVRPARFTADVTPPADGGEVGILDAVITVFGEPDSYGRIIEAGAFDASIKAHGLPAVVWTHLWEETPIGVTMSLTTDGDALIARGRLYVGDKDQGGSDFGSVTARDIWRACTLKGGDGLPALREVSIGCYVTADPVEERRSDGGSYWRFSQMDLVEWGPCLRGAHPMARIITQSKPQADPDPTPPPVHEPDEAPAADESADQPDLRLSDADKDAIASVLWPAD